MSCAAEQRTRLLLEAPIAPTLLRLAVPNVVVMVSQACAGLVETHFVGRLGTGALAGMALVFPVFMLMQMLSAGAIGGGIASSIARAIGSGRHDAAAALVRQAILIALGFGLLSTVLMLAAGRWVYASMGGAGAALEAALQYSTVAFGGAVFVWLFNALAAALRGSGNMAVPAYVTVAGLAVLVPASPLLIFGWGPVPAFGIAGGAMAVLLYYALGSAILLAYVRATGTLSWGGLAGFRVDRLLARQILGLGMLSAVGTLFTNLSIMVATAFVGHYGIAALAGYGTASRLEYLLVPLVFGFGAPMLSLVGTCIGAGKRERALHAAWIGAGMVFLVTETVGLAAALFPRTWLMLFSSDPIAIETGSQYLRIVAPFYGLFGAGLALYFASQGAGRLRWPVAGNAARLGVVAAGSWLVVQFATGPSGLYAVQALGLTVYCLVIAWSVAGGAWFGKPGRPASPAALIRRLSPVSGPAGKPRAPAA